MVASECSCFCSTGMLIAICGLTASESLVAFQSANSQPTTIGLSDTRNHLCWQAPPVNFVKVKWDAAMDKHNCRMGIAIIIRDSMGEVLATLSAPKEFIITPDIAKATATLRLVQFTRDLGFYKLVLEGDAF